MTCSPKLKPRLTCLAELVPGLIEHHAVSFTMNKAWCDTNCEGADCIPIFSRSSFILLNPKLQKKTGMLNRGVSKTHRGLSKHIVQINHAHALSSWEPISFHLNYIPKKKKNPRKFKTILKEISLQISNK